MCELYQNMLVFMIVFEIHCNFFIVLPVRLKTCISNGFFFLKGKRCQTFCTTYASIAKEIFFISYTQDKTQHNERESVSNIYYRKISMKQIATINNVQPCGLKRIKMIPYSQ